MTVKNYIVRSSEPIKNIDWLIGKNIVLVSIDQGDGNNIPEFKIWVEEIK